MDVLVIVIILFLLIFFFKRTFSGAVYAFAIIDIFLRLMSFVKTHINEQDISHIIGKYLPDNIPAIIDKYTDGVLFQILLWVYFAIMCVFLFYIIRAFVRKR